MIELKNVSKYYTANGITNLGLRNISLKLDKNEIVAITGDSGCGKSTLLNVIVKNDSFDDGEIYYKGNETSYFSISDMDDFRKNKVGFIYQNYNIIDSYTVLENVMLPLLLKGIKKSEAKAKALSLLSKVGLNGKEKNRGSKLSGGEKQRCVIARALASDCEILACDEPTGNLDSKNGKEIIELIKSVAKDKLVLIVTHDYSLVSDIATRKIKMADGEIIEDQIFKNVEPDENENIDLDYVPLKKKICYSVAKNNVLFTPKKSIFVSTIFFVIAFMTLFLFQFIYSSNSDLGVNNAYLNKQENRLYVYDNNHKALDTNKIKNITNEYEVNPFFEEVYVYSRDLMDNLIYNDHIKKYTIKKGRLNTSDDEIFIVLPNNSFTDYINDSLDKKIKMSFSNDTKQFTLVGYATSKEIQKPTIINNNSIKRLFMLENTSIALFIGDEKISPIINESISFSKNTLILPSIYQNTSSFYLKLANLYELTNYDVTYSDEITKPTFNFNLNVLNENVFEASIYTNKINKVKNQLEKAGFSVDYPYKLNETLAADVFLNNLTSYGSILISSMVLFILFFITYFVLAKIYTSRKKDYEILRTLGVTKNDMKHIVNAEILFIGLFSIILAFIIAIILIFSIPMLEELRIIKPLTIFIYFVLLALFTYAIARRFNYKLFKFSVATSLKGDE